jgi:hypothetical protein
VLRFACLAALLAAQAQAPTPVVMAERIVAHHEAWNTFFRTYLGCPDGAREVEDCDPANGRLDYGEFMAARRTAMRLFELRAE